MRQPALSSLVLVLLTHGAAAQAVTSPATHLGRPVGGDSTLADWKEVSSYWQKLADESPRVELQRLGETTEGRDFLLATIASEANLKRLDEIKRLSARIADPRGASSGQKEEALAHGVPIVMVSLAMHSTETAGTQFGMELGWLLATSDEEPWKSAREKLVVNVIPCTNPDGLDHVVEWYRQTVGTPHEASGLLKLYQYYAGHDNNRDWFMLTQNETRIVTEQLYRVWRPHVYWDVHQQGTSAERMFVPPFRDPLNPNLDPAIMAGIGTLGSRALFDMTREGLTGISTGVRFDMWWNGGNRNVPVRHNMIGLLTEAASVNVASPIFLPRSDLRGPQGLTGGYRPSNQFPAPWPGGWWRLRDIIDYELAFARSILGSLAREPRTWLTGALAAAERAIESGSSGAPTAWILPSDNDDPGAVRRLVDVLLRTGVEIDLADAAIEADGRTYPPGSLVIRRAQPYGGHVKDLLEVQRYPEGEPPYDVAGWTLPYLLGVHRVEVMGELTASTRRIATPDEAVAAFAGAPEDGAFSESDTWPGVFERLARGESVPHAGGRFDASGGETLARLPRVGVFAPWSGSMDEGWLRWVLDTNGLAYVQVRNEMLRAGKLRDFLDCLVLPSIAARALDEGRAEGSVPDPFAGGLAPEGAVAIEEFVRSGGTLIAVERACPWAIELFGLPLEDVTQGDKARDFSCPGSVLRAIPAESSEPQELTAALPRSLALFFSDSLAWKVKPDTKEAERPVVLLRYAPTRTLLSGWLRGEDVIAGQAAWVRATHGAGRVHLFGFSPHYRGWTQATFQLLFRAMLFDS